VQLVPIATNVVSSNPVHGDVYSMQYYVNGFMLQIINTTVYRVKRKTGGDLTSPDLVFDHVQGSDRGNYSCHVVNAVGNTTGGVIHLKIDTCK
jgi:hypothetical protein